MTGIKRGGAILERIMEVRKEYLSGIKRCERQKAEPGVFLSLLGDSDGVSEWQRH